MSASWWSTVEGAQLAQGDLLPDCCVPVFIDPSPSNADEEPRELDVKSQRLIIVTQSCDLENNKVEFVALCPANTLEEFAEHNPKFENPKEWNSVRTGKEHSLHLLCSPDDPTNNMECYVVDFGHIVSVPYAYLAKHANTLGARWRLDPPYLEHFSQAFARFFMRVGLPSGIAKFN